MTTDDVYLERGISKCHGYLAERYVEEHAYLVPLPETLSQTGVLLEPLAVAEKAVHQAFEIQRRLRIWQPRRAAVLGSGTVGLLTTLALRLRGIEVACLSRRRPPHLNSDLIAEIGGAYLSTADISMAKAAGAYGLIEWTLETVIPGFNTGPGYPGATVENGRQPAPDGPANFPTGWFSTRGGAYKWIAS
jgi:hypothetical protein